MHVICIYAFYEDWKEKSKYFNAKQRLVQVEQGRRALVIMNKTRLAPERQTLSQRLWKNISIIFGGRLVFGVVNLMAAAIAVRACGVEAFGVVALLQAYIRLFAGLLRFDTWAAVTRYGMQADASTSDLQRLLGFTLRLDALAFLVSVLLAALLAPFAGRLFEWPEAVIALAPWYAVNIIFITGATATGFLRLTNRFAVLAQQHGLNALIRLGGVAILWALGGNVVHLAIVWGVGGVVSGIFMMTAAWREAMRRDLWPRFRGSWRELPEGFPNIWRFVIITNLNGMISTVMNHGVILLVGALLGAGGASLFQIARQSTEFMRKASGLLSPIFFPELAKMEAKGKREKIRRLVNRTLQFAVVWLAMTSTILFFGAEPFLRLLFGPETIGAASTMIVCGIATAIQAAGFTFAPALMSIGKESALLKSTIVASVIAAPLIVGLTYTYGLIGAGVGMFLWRTLIFAYRYFSLRQAFKRS